MKDNDKLNQINKEITNSRNKLFRIKNDSDKDKNIDLTPVKIFVKMLEEYFDKLDKAEYKEELKKQYKKIIMILIKIKLFGYNKK